MAERLKLLGKSPRLISLFRAAIFGTLLFWLGSGGHSYPAVLFFLALSSAMYFKPLWNSVSMARSFGALLLITLLAFLAQKDFLAQTFLAFFPILGALIFYLILGLKEYILVHRRFWHFLIFSLLFYQILFFYFLFEKNFSEFYILWPAAMSFLLMSEFLGLQTKAGVSSIRSISATFGLFIIEGILIVKFLPFGFLNSANLVALGGLFFAELALNFYNGLLGWKILISRLVIFTILALSIFLTGWL